MRKFFSNRWRIWAAAGGLLVLAVYLFALLRPGVWYRDTFLYRQTDGSYAGGAYRMTRTMDGDAAEVTFAAGDTQRTWQVTGVEDPFAIAIAQDGTPVFTGHAAPMGEDFLLIDAAGQPMAGMTVSVEGAAASDEEDAFPTLATVYGWARGGESTRGTPILLLPAALLAGLLALDLRFPLLEFQLHTMWYTDDGTPSDTYWTMKKFSRAVLCVAIAGLLIAVFFVHD